MQFKMGKPAKLVFIDDRNEELLEVIKNLTEEK